MEIQTDSNKRKHSSCEDLSDDSVVLEVVEEGDVPSDLIAWYILVSWSLVFIGRPRFRLHVLTSNICLFDIDPSTHLQL